VSKTDPLKRVVAVWAAEQEAAYRAGAASAYRSRNATVGEWADRWWAARDVEASTARKEEAALRNHIRPYWQNWPLTSIGRMDVQAWVTKRAKAGIGNGAIHTAYGLFSMMMADAVREGLILASPCSGVRLPRLTKPTPRWFTRHEYDRLQLALATREIRTQGRRLVPDAHADVWRALLGLACFSGLRPAELAGLDVDALDLDNGLVHVRQVWTREHTIRRYLKSDRSNRFVPFPAEVGDLLWRVAADKPDTAPLFTSPKGTRVEFSGNFRDRVWVPTLEAADIEPVRFYVCRHTAASWLVQAGVPDRKIMAVLGHADTHLIDVYAHLAPKAHDEVRAAWGETFRPTGAPRTPMEVDVDD
jgi:integrase